MAYMAHVTANLPARDEEVEGGHPLVRGEASLAREVVEVGDEAGHEVREACVAALGVDEVCIGGDVVDCEILKGRRVRVCHGC
jgi:hypothetical protein